MPSVTLSASDFTYFYISNINTTPNRWGGKVIQVYDMDIDEDLISFVWYDTPELDNLKTMYNNGMIGFDNVYLQFYKNSRVPDRPSSYVDRLIIGQTDVVRSDPAEDVNVNPIAGSMDVDLRYADGNITLTNPSAVTIGSLFSGYGLILKPRRIGTYYLTYNAPQIIIEYHYNESIVTITGDVEFGTTFTANINANTNTFRHVIECYNGNLSQTTQVSVGVATAQITLPLAWMNQIPNTTQMTVQVKLTTYYGNDVVGSPYIISITVNVPSSIVPTPGMLSYTVSNVFNVPISNLGLIASLSGQAGVYGSTIRNYTIQSEGYSSANGNLVIDAIKLIPSYNHQRTMTISATVIDSRGRTATTSIDITVYEWDLPYFSSIEFYRCNQLGERSESGHYIRIIGTYECYSVNGLNTISPCTIKIVERPTGTQIDGGNLAQNTPKVVGNNLISSDKEYVLQLTLTDRETSVVREYMIYSVEYVIHFKNGGTGVAFGQAATEDETVRINPNWQLIIDNDVDVASTLQDILDRLDALEGN